MIKKTLYFLKIETDDIIYHSYKLIYSQHFLTKEVFKIDIRDHDTGEKELSEIEKWKRKVVLNNKFRHNKVLSLKPTIYKSFIHFYIFSKFDFNENDCIKVIFSNSFNKMMDKKYIHKYQDYIKDYENKLYKKYKDILEEEIREEYAIEY